ncbi:MAG: hypothetical protein E7532_07635 [Ruminococcaceae bacterium]|nr:hypothetical protein [Oscillospiraceae bacterium]
MAKKNLIAAKTPKLKLTVTHVLTMIYTISMFTVFPLFLTDYYQSARRDKFWFFVILTCFIGTGVLVVAIVQYSTKNSPESKRLNRYLDPIRLNITDYGILAFLTVNIISTFYTAYNAEDLNGTLEALWLGSYGRNMGLFMILTIALCYFMVSRFFFYKKQIMYFFFIGMSIMSLVAVLNFYHLDVLNIFSAYSRNQNVQMNFTSTIGNKNYLSAMITVALPFSAGLATASEDKILKIVAYISTGIQFMGLLVATSDGGFLGCFAAIAIMFVIVSRDLHKLSKFFFTLAIMMSSAKLLWAFDLMMGVFGKENKGYTSFSEIFVYSNYVFIFAALFAGLAVGAELLKRRYTKTANTKLSAKNKNIPEDNTDIQKLAALEKNIFIVALSLVCLGFAAIVALFCYYSIINTTTPVGSFTRFFRFNEAWGTHRGYFWIKSFEIFKNMSFTEMLIGTGPDTFYNAFEPYFGELKAVYGDSSTNAAHNVYINYLITLGVTGLLSYLTFVGSAIVNAVKNARHNPLALTCVGVIVAYATQDIVNIANPVNTPWFIMFIALSESVALRANSTDRLIEEKF